MSLQSPKVAAGLDGVIAAETRLSSIDGQAGKLIIAGFPLEEIASRATFEEMLYLLWHDTLPTAEQLAEFRQSLAKFRTIPQATHELLKAAAVKRIPGIDALRMAASSLSLDLSPEADDRETAQMLVARFPTIVAAYWRLVNGQTPITPRADLSHAENYLYMLFGEVPSAARTRAMETYLNTVADHGLNASTFTARVIVSTDSDFVSAIVGAIGALKGPKHGGAPGPALDMVFEIGEASQAEPYLRRKLEAGELLMGFGHRVYKVRDPRADVLAVAAAELFREDGDMHLYELAQHVEKTAIRLLEAYKPGRRLQTNVEFYTALVLHGLDLPTDLFTPTFAVSRVAGWTAHSFEQKALNKIIRPASVYVGDENRSWEAVTVRG